MLQNTQFSKGGGRHKGEIFNFEFLISVENLLLAWQEFIKGKSAKRDVQEFSLHLMDSILTLHSELKQQTYQHGGYHHFRISDPKPRDIHKASVRDRLVHHAIYRVLYPYFDKKFIYDSYSCRLGKGTHRALNRFRDFAYKVSQNHTRTCWVLKCDIRKFFANIDHEILYLILSDRKISDNKILWLLKNVIDSFWIPVIPAIEPESIIGCGSRVVARDDRRKGLPLGNLTSQLLVNIYMNEFDQFVKHTLREKCYIRYADDFVFLSENHCHLQELIPKIVEFLWGRLRLTLHPDKTFIKTYASGVDFLGWVHFVGHRVLRTASKRRMFRRLSEHPSNNTIASYRGLLKHGNTFKMNV